MGPLIATVPLRVVLKPQQTVSAFLEQVQDQATDMIPHEHDGLRRIKQHLPHGVDCDFANLLVVQSVDTGSDSFQCLGSQLTMVENHSFDTYPLVLECLMRGTTEVELKARFRPFNSGSCPDHQCSGAV